MSVGAREMKWCSWTTYRSCWEDFIMCISSFQVFWERSQWNMISIYHRTKRSQNCWKRNIFSRGFFYQPEQKSKYSTVALKWCALARLLWHIATVCKVSIGSTQKHLGFLNLCQRVVTKSWALGNHSDLSDCFISLWRGLKVPNLHYPLCCMQWDKAPFNKNHCTFLFFLKNPVHFWML